MKLIDYIKSNQNTPSKSTALRSTLNSNLDISCLRIGLKNKENEKEKFQKKITDLVLSEKFLEDLSNVIGTPKPGESEEAFIKRAKFTMKILLANELES